jgi:hypothetical protein
MSIIAISGFSGSGKDTVGSMIAEFDHINKWKIKRWADKLKQVASLITGIPVEKFEDQEFKKTELGSEWAYKKKFIGRHFDAFVKDWKEVDVPMTVRDLLQLLGTEAMRKGLHENVWINALMSDYIAKDNLLPNWIITDTRFKNETSAVKNKGGIIIRVNRKGVGPLNDHSSENELTDYSGFVYVINNDGSLEDLKDAVRHMLEHFSIGRQIIYNK